MEDAHQQHKPATGYPVAQPSYPTGPTATAYPYHAPPPPSYYPNTYPAHPPPHYDHRRATFLRRLIVAAVSVFIIMGAVSFIIWLVLRPHLPEFSVSSASVSALNFSSSSSSQLTADWDFTISVRNPNKKMTVDYDTVQATVVHRFSPLAETTLAPFYQGKGNFTTIRARFAAVGNYVDDQAVRDLTADRTDGNVEFGLRLFSWVRFRAGTWRTRRHMRVWCAHVRVGFPSTGRGSLSGTPMECNVDL